MFDHVWLRLHHSHDFAKEIKHLILLNRECLVGGLRLLALLGLQEQFSKVREDLIVGIFLHKWCFYVSAELLGLFLQFVDTDLSD